MSYRVTLKEIRLQLNVRSDCRLMVYYIDRGVKHQTGSEGTLQDGEVYIHEESVFHLSHQTLILDFVLVKANSEGRKKKAGHVVVQLLEHKEFEIIRLELVLEECIIKDSLVQIEFTYQKLSPEQNPSTFQRISSQNQTQLGQRVLQLEQTNAKQQETINSLQEQLQQSLFDLEEERNKIKRVEETYRKEKERFELATLALNQQLVATKSQLTSIIDILNDRGEASILENIEDFITM